jgi:hypothetical protein
MNPEENQPSPAGRADSLADIRRVLLADDARVLRIVLRDTDMFRLCNFYQLDPSICGIRDQWSATLVEPIGGTHPDFMRLFLPGSGLDFIATDITTITDDQTGALLYSAAGSAHAQRSSHATGNANQAR